MPDKDANPVSLESIDTAILNALLETIPDMVYFKDTEGRYVRISRSHAKILGLSDPAEAIGRTVSEFVSAEHGRDSMREEQEVLQTGKPIESKEELVTLKDGRTLWFSTTKRLWRDETGKTMGTIGIIRNIDSEKRARDSLAAEQIVLRTIIDHLPSRIFVKNADARFVLNNKEHLKSLGVSAQDEAVGKRTLDFFPGERGEQAARDDKQVLGGGPAIFDQEKSDFGEEGSARWSLTTKVPLKGKSGGVMGLVGISHDITERRRYEEELRRKNAEMEADLRMASQMQHAFLPQSYPEFPPGVGAGRSALQFAHCYMPSATLGGDFFDVVRVSDHEAGVMICDVMGHGVRAGLITALIRGLIEEMTKITGRPSRMLAEINRGLAPFLSQTGLPVFASVFYGVVDVRANTLRYTNAGHPWPYILRRGSGALEALASSDPEPAAGLDTDFHYAERTISFGPGEALFLFSDGLFESQNKSGEQLGEPNLRSLVKSEISRHGADLLDAVLKGLGAHTGDAKLEDDVCMLLVERRN